MLPVERRPTIGDIGFGSLAGYGEPMRRHTESGAAGVG